jgi:hypothetical protein
MSKGNLNFFCKREQISDDDLVKIYYHYCEWLKLGFFKRKKENIHTSKLNELKLKYSLDERWDQLLNLINPKNGLPPINKENIDTYYLTKVEIERRNRKLEENKKKEKLREKWEIQKEERKKQKIINDQINKEKLDIKKSKFLDEFDKDRNGIIDIIEGDDDFIRLFRKHQKIIYDFDKSYINTLQRVSSYLKIKRENIQSIYSSIIVVNNNIEFEEQIGVLQNQIHSYKLLLFHSLNMITSIVECDYVTVSEIYESFDKLNIFNSNWENEISHKISDINNNLENINQNLKIINSGLKGLLHSIQKMEMNIINGLDSLSYVTQDGFSDLNSSLSRELQSIDSSIQSNNLLNTIQTYQLYKINKQTKGLIG